MAWFTTLREFLGIQKKDDCLCMIVTEQEGSEIWINGKNTGQVTPKPVYIPKHVEVQLTLKLTGHRDHVAYLRSSSTLTYYHCRLERIPLRLIHNENCQTAAL